MKRDFDLLMGEVERLHGELVASVPHKRTEIPKAFAYPGVYAFSEWGKFRYVGRSGNVRKRIWEQCQPGRKWNDSIRRGWRGQSLL